MANLSVPIDVAGVVAYPVDPQVTIPFDPDSVAVFNEHPNAVIDVSFNGVTDAGRLIPGTSTSIGWEQRVHRVWLKVVAPSPPGPVTVRVLAEQG